MFIPSTPRLCAATHTKTMSSFGCRSDLIMFLSTVLGWLWEEKLNNIGNPEPHNANCLLNSNWNHNWINIKVFSVIGQTWAWWSRGAKSADVSGRWVSVSAGRRAARLGPRFLFATITASAFSMQDRICRSNASFLEKSSLPQWSHVPKYFFFAFGDWIPPSITFSDWGREAEGATSTAALPPCRKPCKRSITK